MRNENLYTMEQPELGKKISEIRKQKGLTQEELVEKCNINVRTIQRIEAGEVTPRSYTIKTILEVLGVDYNNIINPKITLNKFDSFFNIKPSTIQKELTIAWIFGIVFFIISFVEYPMDFLHLEQNEFVSKPWYIVVKLISVISFTLFMRGFVVAGCIYNNQLLNISTYLLIIFNVLFVIFDISSLYAFNEILEIATIAKLIIYGVLTLLIGLGVFNLKKHLESIAIATGILMIICGICIVTVFLAPAYLFLSIPLEILQIILLFMIAKKLNS